MKALSGKVIISTRPVTEDDHIHKRLSEEGAIVVHLPLIEISAAQDDENTNKAIHQLDNFSWIIFTSSNGVKYFFDSLENKNIPGEVKVAVYGNRTESELNKQGIIANFKFHGGTSTDFYNVFHDKIKESDNLLLIQGNLAPQFLKHELSFHASVQRINVYQTTLPKFIDKEKLLMIEDDQYDLILFTSPSGFDNFKSVINDQIDLSKLRIISIGRKTAQAIEQDIHPLVIAETPDADGIINGIIKIYKDFQTK